MKSDLSRETFDPGKHYSGVRMQQGRVQVDADWNEQVEITLHRIEREAVDLIGVCGGPIHNAGFGITKGIILLAAGNVAALNVVPTLRLGPLTNPGIFPNIGPDDFLLTAGRYYVDGILCEIDAQTLFSQQPDLPHRPEILAIPVDSLGHRFPAYLAYLDVWRRSITALDDPRLREVALGGPDTATRTKTIWQVKLAAVINNNCIDAFAELKNQRQPSSGRMSARTTPSAATTDPCIVPSTAGFRGLENQFYRIEIHNPGTGFNISTSGGGTPITLTSDPTKITVTGFNAGQAVELFLTGPSTDPTFRKLFYVVSVDKVGGTITLNSSLSGVRQQDAPQIRAVGATFKWSRDNGSVVTLVTKIDKNDARVLTVLNVGNDSVTGFAPDQWVELIDDTLELNGLPGQLLQIAEVDPARQLITLKSPAAPLSLTSLPSGGVDPAFHPKLRRWDGVGAVDISSTGLWIGIESGIQISFAAGSYQNGDYWTIPARTATADAESGNIEWPHDANSLPLSLSPFGIDHHYCPLAILDSNLAPTSDCRRLFPPVTELTSLLYVDGDGQESMPPQKVSDKLPNDLQVRVANGQIPVIGAQVTFKITNDSGKGLLNQTLNTRAVTVTTTAPDGIATCSWTLDPTTTGTAKGQGQQVEARLLDPASLPISRPIDGQVVRFNADLSIASEVAYFPPDGCASLQGDQTVQDALDDLAAVTRIYYVGGTGQTASPPPNPATGFIRLSQPLEVAVYSNCGPATGRTVRFKIVSGGGSLAPKGGADVLVPVDVAVDGTTGVASCLWSIDPTKVPHVVEARLLDPTKTNELDPPVHFTANFGPGFRVNAVLLRSATGTLTPLANDSTIRSNQLGPGIAVQFSQPANPGMINGKPVCRVAVDVPFPLSGDEAKTWGSLGVGARPVTVRAAITAAAGNAELDWTPTDAFQLQAYLNRVFALMSVAKLNPPLLARLTVTGSFIASAADPSLFLDGKLFGALGPGNQVLATLPSGAGRPGSDLEMWFWIGLGPLEINSVSFISINPNLVETAVASVSLPPPNPQPTLSTLSSVNTLDIAFNRPVTLGLTAPTQSVILEATPAGAGTTRVNGILTQRDPLTIRFSLVTPATGGLPSLTAADYKLTVVGIPRGTPPIPAATATDDKTPLDGAYNGLPGTDFIFNFSVRAPIIGVVNTLGTVVGGVLIP